jgi:hypothetical protein
MRTCSGNLEFWEPSQHSLLDTGKPRKTCVEVAGRRTYRILTSNQQSGIKINDEIRRLKNKFLTLKIRVYNAMIFSR